MQELNTLIDAAEALEATAAGLSNGSSSNASSASPPSVNPSYVLTFFHHTNTTASNNDGRGNDAPDEISDSGGGGGGGGWGGRGGGKGGGGDGGGGASFRGEHALNEVSFHSGLKESGSQKGGEGERIRGAGGGGGEEGGDRESASPLVELRAELRFPPVLSPDPSGSLLGQLRRQLDGLLRRVPGFDDGSRGASPAWGAGGGRGEMAMGEGMRVAEGKTEESFYGQEAFRAMFRDGRRRKPPPRDGLRMER